MKVRFSAEVMEDPHAARHLTAIFWTFVDGRHDWVVPEPEDVAKSRWCQGEGPDLKRVIRELAEQCGRKTAPKAKLEVSVGPFEAGDVLRANPRDAALYLCAPLVLLVENARCDGAFVRMILHRIRPGTTKRRLGGQGVWDQLRNDWGSGLGDGRWLAVRHGGGHTTAQQLELLADASAPLPPRVVVVLDSDCSSPQERERQVGATANQVRELMKRKSDILWLWQPFILQKREVENYIPESALQHRHGRSPAWKRYESGFDKDYGDLKALFGGDPWKLLIDSDCERYFHENALRARAGNNGAELEKLVAHVLNALEG